MNDLQPDPVMRFFGGLLIAVGGSLTVLCGGCTLVFAGGSMVGAIGNVQFGDLAYWLLLIAFIGGLPTLIGVRLFFWGQRLYRPRPAKPATFTDGPDEAP